MGASVVILKSESQQPEEETGVARREGEGRSLPYGYGHSCENIWRHGERPNNF